MRYVFMGTPRFAEIILRDMIQAGRPPVGVMTQVDQPAGRGRVLTPSQVKKLALEYDLPLRQPEKIGDKTRAWIKEQNPDICIVAAYGKILAKATLEVAPFGCINAHGSLLPKYRGAAPIARAIINGEKQTGVTIMHVDEGSDTGDIISQKAIPIEPDETQGTLFDKVAHLSGPLLIQAMDDLEAGAASRIRQQDTGIEPTYAERLTKTDGRIDWNWPAQRIVDLVRGTNPWPGAFSTLRGQTLKVLEAEIGQGQGAPGELLDIQKDGWLIGTGQGAICLKTVQLEGRRAIPCYDCAQGLHLQSGQRLGDE